MSDVSSQRPTLPDQRDHEYIWSDSDLLLCSNYNEIVIGARLRETVVRNDVLVRTGYQPLLTDYLHV